MPEINLGKKVFILYPQSVIQKELIDILIDKEYEIYRIEDYRLLPVINRTYNNAIVFINIDEKLSIEEWAGIIKSYTVNPSGNDIKIGIISYNSDKKITEKFLMDLRVPCGFVRLKLGLDDSLNIMLSAFKANEVKGKRKYIRASFNNKYSRFYYKHYNNLKTGYINDISSVGMTIVFDNPTELPKNSLLENLQLRIKGRNLIVSGVIIGSRQLTNNTTIYVVLFDQTVEEDTKSKIRSIIHKTLEEKIMNELLVPSY